MTYVLTVCLDGVPDSRDFDAIEETIEATGEAICRHEEEPTKIVTLLLSERSQDYRAGQEPPARSDKEALDELNLMLSAPEWPGASGMEDVCMIVRSTGRTEIPNAPEWPSH